MIDPKSKLTVLFDDNGSVADISNSMADMLRDEFAFEMIAAEDKFYIGYHKPFNTCYVKLTTPGENAATISVEAWTGSAWEVVDSEDGSLGLTRDGYVRWDKTSMQSTTVNSLDKHFVRLSISADQSASVLRGVNLVFADDTDMKSEFYEITNSNILPAGENSHIGTHVATRNYILHYLRNYYTKQGASASTVEKINQFDIIDIYEIKEAAIYLSLSKIFFNLSDSVDDNYWVKYREYQDKFEEKMITARLSVDLNDDGVDDDGEVQAARKQTRWAR